AAARFFAGAASAPVAAVTAMRKAAPRTRLEAITQSRRGKLFGVALLEGDVVVAGRWEAFVAAAAAASRRLAAAAPATARRTVATPAATTTGAAARTAATEERDRGGHERRHGGLVRRVLVIPRARCAATRDVDLAPLVEVLRAVLALLAPGDHPVPLGAFLLLLVLVGEALVGGDAHLAHRLPRRQMLQLRLGAEVADE